MGRVRRSSGPVERLTPRQLAEISYAALASARRLFNDAEVLSDSNRLPSSFVLLGLCVDELGKHVMVTAFCEREDTDAEWAAFWARFRRHEAKLDVALAGAWLEDLLDLGDPMSGHELHKYRLAATYVDLDPLDGSIRTPDSVVTAELARRWLIQIRRYLESCEFTMARTDVDRLTEVFERARKRPRPKGDPTLTLAQAVSSRYGLSAVDGERLAGLTQGLTAESANALGDGSSLFAKIATVVLGIDVTASEAARMLEIVERVKAERDDLAP